MNRNCVIKDDASGLFWVSRSRWSPEFPDAKLLSRSEARTELRVGWIGRPAPKLSIYEDYGRVEKVVARNY